jgi:Ner family transcriptional regulator
MVVSSHVREFQEPYKIVRRFKPHHLSSGDIHPADVKAALSKRGLTLSALARRHDKETSYFRDALRKPYPKAMRLLARALTQRPHELWPSLFDEDDQPIKRLQGGKSRARRTIRGGRKTI